MFTVVIGSTGGVAQSVIETVAGLVQEAANVWARYIDLGTTSLEIELSFDSLGGTTLASGGSDFFFQTSGQFAGFFQATSALELQDGVDRNGQGNADLFVTIDADRLSNGEFFLGGPNGGGVPNNQFDLFSIVLHELAHGLGFLGFGEGPGGDESVFDSFVSDEGDAGLFFNGPEAVALVGGPLQLVDDSHVDLGNDLLHDTIGRGNRRPISNIDVSVLQDIGLPILGPTSGDDVLYGFEFINLGSGIASGNDVIDLLAGDDLYFGLSGNDTINGGDGDDVIVAGTGSDIISGGAGSDVFWIYDYQAGNDIVLDFDPLGQDSDRLGIADSETFSVFTDILAVAEQDGSDVLITLSSVSTVRLIGVDISELSAGSFVFSDGVVQDDRFDLPPEFTSETVFQYLENSQSPIGTVSGFDPNGTPVSFSILEGRDGNFFEIDESTGIISARGVFDFENPIDRNQDNVYSFDVSIESNGLSSSQEVIVNVLNEFEPITFFTRRLEEGKSDGIGLKDLFTSILLNQVIKNLPENSGVVPAGNSLASIESDAYYIDQTAGKFNVPTSLISEDDDFFDVDYGLAKRVFCTCSACCGSEREESGVEITELNEFFIHEHHESHDQVNSVDGYSFYINDVGHLI